MKAELEDVIFFAVQKFEQNTQRIVEKIEFMSPTNDVADKFSTSINLREQ